MDFHHHILHIEIVGVLNTTTLPKHFDSRFRFSLKVSATLRAAKPITFVRQRNVFDPKSAIYEGVLEIVDAPTGAHICGGKIDYFYVPPRLNWENEDAFITLLPDEPIDVDVDLDEWRKRETLINGRPGLSSGTEDRIEIGRKYKFQFITDYAIKWWAWGRKAEVLHKPHSIWNLGGMLSYKEDRRADDLPEEEWAVPAFGNEVAFVVVE